MSESLRIIDTQDQLFRFLAPNKIGANFAQDEEIHRTAKLPPTELEKHVLIQGFQGNRPLDRLDDVRHGIQVMDEYIQLASRSDTLALKRLHRDLAQYPHSSVDLDEQLIVQVQMGRSNRRRLMMAPPVHDENGIPRHEYETVYNPDAIYLGDYDETGVYTVVPPQDRLTVVTATETVIEHILADFNDVVVVEGENRRLRKSSSVGEFKYTVLQTPDKTDEELLESVNGEVVFMALPLHRVARIGARQKKAKTVAIEHAERTGATEKDIFTLQQELEDMY